ncbi:cell growth regulator with EF hand domain protein 1 isoform X2 [Anabas testudineus]|nr:cell growth regulator with EF hand domain protein 1 isoform X2 [Anabas testudineus]
MESLLSKLVPRVLSLLLLINLCLAAPGLPGTQREEGADVQPPPADLHNPFGAGEEDRRLLQSYIQSSLKDGQGGPEINTWEQEVFFLFGLYDYDRSGLLDGLEMMKLVSDYNSHHTPGAQANEQVVSMVDFLLQTQDLNQNGLLAPSELLSPALPHTQDSSSDANNAPHQEQEEVAVEEKLSDPSTDKEKGGAVEQREEAHEEVQVHKEEHLQHEVKPEEEQATKQTDEHNELPEAPAAEQVQDQHQGVPVHQGQPEI